MDNLRSLDQGTTRFRYNYDVNWRLSTIKNPSNATLYSFTHDPRGNMLTKNSQDFVFDAANRMSSAETTALAGSQVYLYDGMGRRVQTTDPNDSTTFWIYSKAGQVLYTSEARRGQNLSYIYLGNTQVATRAVAFGTGTQTVRYQFTDALGSPVASANATADLTSVLRTNYTPYGEAMPVVDGTGYTGHAMDQASGLTYMQKRYYDPLVGSFLSMDPAPVIPAGTTTFCRYCYAGDNPTNRVDPDGRNWFSVNGRWEYHRGSTYTTPAGANLTSHFTHLLVLIPVRTSSTGATVFAATLFNQARVVGQGSYFSGGAGHERVPAGNYTIRGDIHNPAPTHVDPNSTLRNPPPAYGIQQIGTEPLPDPSNGKYYDVFGAYGPIRAYLNPWNPEVPNSTGNYLHGQAASGPAAHGWTHGCMCYGQDTQIITTLWNLGERVPVDIQ